MSILSGMLNNVHNCEHTRPTNCRLCIVHTMHFALHNALWCSSSNMALGTLRYHWTVINCKCLWISFFLMFRKYRGRSFSEPISVCTDAQQWLSGFPGPPRSYDFLDPVSPVSLSDFWLHMEHIMKHRRPCVARHNWNALPVCRVHYL